MKNFIYSAVLIVGFASGCYQLEHVDYQKVNNQISEFDGMDRELYDDGIEDECDVSKGCGLLEILGRE
jgi:hypothetical protein